MKSFVVALIVFSCFLINSQHAAVEQQQPQPQVGILAPTLTGIKGIEPSNKTVDNVPQGVGVAPQQPQQTQQFQQPQQPAAPIVTAQKTTRLVRDVNAHAHHEENEHNNTKSN